MKKPAISAVFLGEKALRDGTPLINALRSSGIKIAADYDDRPLKSQLKTADKEGTRYVLILGENELGRREFLFKDMKSGSQQFVSFDSIEQFLKGLIDAADAHMR
jgi:histidyl-tRNA synthetase